MPLYMKEAEMNLFQAAFYDSPIPQAILDLDGNFLRVNDALCQYLGRGREELLAHSFLDFAIDADRDVDIPSELQKASYWSAKRKYLRKDGMVLRAILSVSGIHEKGVLTKIIVQLQDQAKSYDLWDRLKKKQEEVEQFAYIASHDLREPLTTMAGYATLLQRRCSDAVDDTGKRWMEEILNSARYMEEKLDDLLEFSRAGRTTAKGTFPLGVAIDEARRSVVVALKETGGEILFTDENPLIRGDRSMVAQIFQNLFSNSLKYRSEVTPRIEIRTERHGDKWRIEVQDNGLGFDMQFKDRIFGVFQRLYTVEQYPGTGIGLAIAKKIVERHEGTIWTNSTQGEGSTFYFTLPAAT
jgi:PAS domain S-box-containing protein